MHKKWSTLSAGTGRPPPNFTHGVDRIRPCNRGSLAVTNVTTRRSIQTVRTSGDTKENSRLHSTRVGTEKAHNPTFSTKMTTMPIPRRCLPRASHVPRRRLCLYHHNTHAQQDTKKAGKYSIRKCAPRQTDRLTERKTARQAGRQVREYPQGGLPSSPAIWAPRKQPSPDKWAARKQQSEKGPPLDGDHTKQIQQKENIDLFSPGLRNCESSSPERSLSPLVYLYPPPTFSHHRRCLHILCPSPPGLRLGTFTTPAVVGNNNDEGTDG